MKRIQAAPEHTADIVNTGGSQKQRSFSSHFMLSDDLLPISANTIFMFLIS